MSLRPVWRPIPRPEIRGPFDRGFGGGDPDAMAWAAAVIANGGTYSASTLAAVNTFVLSAKASGYWSKLNRINLFCGDQLAACLVPLKAGGGSATETNVNFVSGDYSEATGLTGNGSTKYLRTGLVPSVSLTLNDTHLAVYNRAAGAAGGGIHIGTRNGATLLELSAPFTDGVAYSSHYNNTTGAVSGAVAANYGLIVGSRESAASHAVYKNGSSVASNATSGGALLATEIYVFASDNIGAGAGFVSHSMGAYSVGAGLTAADVTAYATHMEAFQDALGRGVA